MDDGGVILGYNGIPDTTTALDENLVVGVSTGDRTADARTYQFSRTHELTLDGTIYEVFQQGVDFFDLDGGNIIFTPFAVPQLISVPVLPPWMRNSDFVSPPALTATTPEPGTFFLFGIGIIGMVVYGWRRRKLMYPDKERSSS